MDRYDKFLQEYLPKYLSNELIQEIIITDENGNDYQKIKENFPNPKIKLFKNESRLGPFLNKIGACKKAASEYIVLMDSDNFADNDYFENANKFILSKQLSKYTILAPSFAKPNFDYRKLSGVVLTKGNMQQYLQDKSYEGTLLCLMNTGNYVINKYLIDNIDFSKETNNIQQSSSCDVIFFNMLLYEQFPLKMYVLNELQYSHVVHNHSIYIQTHAQHRNFNEQIHNRFKLIGK